MPIFPEAAGYHDRVDAPAREFSAITPSDSTNLSKLTKGIYFGGAGNAVVVDINDNATTFNGIAAGGILPIRAKRINATGTTATSIVGLF